MGNIDGMLSRLGDIARDLEGLYRDLHAQPELSGQEHRTAERAASEVVRRGFEVFTGVGGTGVVALLRNGDGPTVMLRADMDALPVRELTELPYASKVTALDSTATEVVPVMHACGHDMHITWLVGAAELMAKGRETWSGTLLLVFQPAEETAKGAQAMIEDGLFERFPVPDVILGQHVMPLPAGHIAYRSGAVLAAADCLDVRLIGRGAHGSRPEASIDPVVMAASTVLRLQTVVSRELSPAEGAVVTIGALHAGSRVNVIPEEALLKINVRTFDQAVRRRVLDAITRIIKAEALASGSEAPPSIVTTESFPLTTNDRDHTERLARAFRQWFGGDRVGELQTPMAASEDFGWFSNKLGTKSVYWFVGGTDPDLYRKAEQAGRVQEDVPTNHSSKFAPVVHPTIETGVEALVTAAVDSFRQ